MNKMTAMDLRSAFAAESMSSVAYDVLAEKALEEGLPNVSRLLHAIAFSEAVHARRFFRELRGEEGRYAITAMAGFGVSATRDNLIQAIEGEEFIVEDMYATYIRTAQAKGEKSAAQSFEHASLTEKSHQQLCRRVLDAIESGQDLPTDPFHVCQFCGNTLQGDAPRACSICGSAGDQFKAFE